MSGESPLVRPVQVAYAVSDVHVAADRFAATTGAGPFFVIEHIALAEARVHGVPGEFDHSSGYGQWGDIMVELVQEHTPALVVPPSVHHVAFMVDDLRTSIAWCAAQGWPEVMFARTTTGQEFAFCDARAILGHLIEMYEPSPRLLEFYAKVAAAHHASGPPANQRSNIGRIATVTSSTINPLGG